MADDAAEQPNEPTDKPKKKKSGWAHVFTIAMLVIGLSALAYTVYDVGFDQLWDDLKKIGWWFLAVMGLEVIISSLDAAAMYQFLSPDQRFIPYRRALLAQVSGRAVNVVVPSGNVGEVVKVSVLVEGGVHDARAVAGIVVYNLAGLLAEATMVAVGAPIMALVVPMGWGLRAVLFGAAGFCVVLGLALFVLVQKGMLVTFARAFRRMRLISQTRFERWSEKLGAIDAKIRIEPGPQLRDRWVGIVIVFLSRTASWSMTAVLLHAVGQPITFGYYAAITVGGFAVYLIATLVPFGLGVSEGGNAALFKALGINPAIGVATALAKRVRDIVYATIGLVLLLASETVQEARARGKRKPAMAAEGDASWLERDYACDRCGVKAIVAVEAVDAKSPWMRLQERVMGGDGMAGQNDATSSLGLARCPSCQRRPALAPVWSVARIVGYGIGTGFACALGERYLRMRDFFTWMPIVVLIGMGLGAVAEIRRWRAAARLELVRVVTPATRLPMPKAIASLPAPKVARAPVANPAPAARAPEPVERAAPGEGPRILK